MDRDHKTSLSCFCVYEKTGAEDLLRPEVIKCINATEASTYSMFLR